MKKTRFALVSLLVAGVVFGVLTWPLARHWHDGMASSNRPEEGGARYMIPGDHLQFLYQLWMLADACTGQTPLFYHVYEFNQGNDQALYNPGSYYFPFGLIYAAGERIGGRVAGWNLMIFLTVWWLYLSTAILLRRFTHSWREAGVAALPSILLPYFHVSILGGSPTGLGMLWVPLIMLGVDVAVRDRRVWGGVLAGGLLAISSWVDLHVFFFIFLATPVWLVMSAAFARWGCEAFSLPEPGYPEGFHPHSHAVAAPELSGTVDLLVAPDGRDEGSKVRWLDRVVPLLPVLAGMILAYLQTALIRATLNPTLQAQGRSLKESMGYALRAPGWFDPALDNRFNIVYVGDWVAALMLAGLLVLLVDVIRRHPAALARLLLYGMVLLAIGGITLLALGPNTPLDREHRLWQLVRTVIPPFRMIRQPAKIYCLLAPFLGLALVLALDRFHRAVPRRWLGGGLAALVAAGCLWDYGRRIEPTICLLDQEQAAYRAVAEDAAATGDGNRALAIPLWPGDSHWNSITEYYSTLYRTKMLNGYSPSVSRQYFAEVFLRFERVNMGLVTDEILDGLGSMKIKYLILHEDAFPQKVSPFPSSQTLAELMRHPRLRLLMHDKAVWSFKILPPVADRGAAAGGIPGSGAVGGRAVSDGGGDTNRLERVCEPSASDHQEPVTILSAWQWDACDMAGGTATVEKDGVNIFMRLGDPESTLTLDARGLYGVEGLRYVASVSGNGVLAGSCGTGLSNDAFRVTVSNGNEWGWIELPLPALPHGQPAAVALALTNVSGRVDISMLTMVAGPWAWLKAGESLCVPAVAFCRTGYSDEKGDVHLDRDRTQASVAFYAPVMPVVPGTYSIQLDYTIGEGAGVVPEGVQLGEWTVLRSDGQDRLTVPVLAGQPGLLEYRLESPRPLRLEFRYNRAVDMVIHGVKLRRVE